MLRVGMIGLGGIARSHCEAIAGLADVEVVACADLIEEDNFCVRHHRSSEFL